MKRFVLSVLMLLIVAMGYSQTQTQGQEVSSATTRYGQTMYYINNFYLDTVNFGAIVDEAIKASVAELDPHSSFISAEDVKAMDEPLVGEFEGIGVEFAIIADTLTIQAPIHGGPSERVGIRAGDKLITVDGENVAGVELTNDKVFKLLRGKKGTKVNVAVKRRGLPELIDFTIVRDKIPLFSVDAVYEPKNDYLYVKLSRFAISSHVEVKTALEEHLLGLKGVILDLRGNSGGYMSASIDIANDFLDKGDLIVYTEGRKIPTMREFANGRGIYKTGPLVILIDEHSASASEIVAGAIQDWDRGIVIGRRSFGKGLVQQGLPLNDGSQLRLTIGRYHTPSGRVIQSPYESGHKEDYYRSYYERFVKGESFSKDSINFPDSLMYKTLDKGRIVFGGGGIMPDIFVPQDTTNYTDYYASILRQGIVPEFVNDKVDKNRAAWKKEYPDYATFASGFSVSDDMFQKLIDFAKEKGIEPNQEEIETSKTDLKLFIKALIASSIVGRDAFYREINTEDPEYNKALEVLENWTKYSDEILK